MSYAYDAAGWRIIATRNTLAGARTTQLMWDEFSGYGDIRAQFQHGETT